MFYIITAILCSVPPPGVSTTHVTHKSYPPQTIVNYTCEEHYKHTEGNLSLICDDSGDWAGEIPRCECE